jgi:2-alkyl-3-oxoalkanoate reductase
MSSEEITMKVFVAGATGAMGRRLVPMLVAGGYEVAAMTRSPQKAAALRAAGAQPVIAEALGRGAVVEAVRRARPEVVIHQLTGLTGVKNFKNFDREFALTNRLRTESIDYLLEGARAAGAGRFIAQSYGGWTYERSGSGLKSEDDPLDPAPPANQTASLAALRYLDEKVAGATDLAGLAFRYANFYGPGSSIALDGDIVAMVRKRQLPVIGTGAGVWSFVHIDDAAAATVAAVRAGAAGLYNIVDDEPAPVADWLPELARAVGAKPPRRVPVWLGRVAAGDVGVSMMTQIRGMSNAKAKRELGWSPRYPATARGSATVSPT